MFTLVTSEDIAESMSHTPIQRCLRGVQRRNKVLDFLSRPATAQQGPDRCCLSHWTLARTLQRHGSLAISSSVTVNSVGCKPQIAQAPLRNGSYYMNGKIVCLKCPAGYFVKKDCVISYTQGICKMCNPGENYSAHETGLNSCLTCTKCRADQEEISYCNITKNTVCRCRKGTYCPTNSTSTQCLPCRSSCPEKQVLQQTCNSTSDIVCVPVTPDPTVYYILVSFGILVPAVIIGICAWFFCRKSGDVIAISLVSPEIIPIPIHVFFSGLIRIRKDNDPKHTFRLCKGYLTKKESDGVLRQMTWPPQSPDMNQSRWFVVFTKCLRHKADSEEDAKEQFLQQENKLYMTNYLTKDEVIASTFSIFVALVPSRVFKKFVLELGLTKNEINLIKQDIRATEEQHYAMLSQLHRNQKFDVNIWLRKLAFIKLDNVAQEICTRLIEDELFERSI
ncbi:unnamed protein product [Ranitomeya imitator]|uniref:TNFR-Cys domain-containing protein n=1 Tax=Ranitomeya imitator TaxID=111125 RepID=A0ABN9MHM0_9NEOB|nr:unnamed protein product [Ranitomeya imitator]